MSDGSSLKEIVVEEATSQLDDSDLLGGSLEEGFDPEEIGVSAGGRVGERIGRSVGESIGESVHETVTVGIEEGRSVREILADLKTSIIEAISAILRGERAESTVSDVSEKVSDTEVGERVTDAAPTELLEDEEDVEGEETDEELEGEEAEEDVEGEEADEELEGEEAEEDVEGEETEADEEDVEGEETEADVEGEETEADVEGEEADEPSTADLEDLKRETLEDFLDVMSYRDLQAVAKDVGVKANLSREEMTAEIVETVSVETAQEEA